ncbi:MAG: hypothetical protein K0S44_220 [Bacteroidetes bacterium]|jgi:hypothetical protein|nr:hypothetical protein [Bacteroidota bacterium]
MLTLVKILSNEVNSYLQRVLKFRRFGLSDVQTAIEAAPFGTDGNVPKDWIAVYGPTATKGEAVIIGYLNKNQMAKVGELRHYSTDADGNEKFYTWLRNDGTYEIGGDTNWAVKFNELKTEFNKLKDDYNNHINEYNLHIHSGGTVSGSTGTTTPSTNINVSNIDNAKNDKIKTIG